MLSKLIKYDFKKVVKVPLVFFVLSILCATLARLFSELAIYGMFFNVLGIVFTSVEYAFIANAIIQPIVRIMTEFGKSMYGDESYLSHTLPVTRQQLLLSKSISSILLMLVAFVSVIVSIFILAYSKTNMLVLENMVKSLFGSDVSVSGVLVMFVLVLFAEFLSLISIVNASIILANRSNDKKVYKGFVYVLLFHFALTIALVAIVVAVVACMGEINILFSVNVSLEALQSSGIVLALLTTALVCYIASAVLFYFVSLKLLKKGVNVA